MSSINEHVEQSKSSGDGSSPLPYEAILQRLREQLANLQRQIQALGNAGGSQAGQLESLSTRAANIRGQILQLSADQAKLLQELRVAR
jgi:chromosome segregation ATPase